MQTIPLFPLNSEIPPRKQKHIGFFVKQIEDQNVLFEITEDFYPHPQCQDQTNPEMEISKLDFRRVAKDHVNSEGLINLFKHLAAATKYQFSKVK